MRVSLELKEMLDPWVHLDFKELLGIREHLVLKDHLV